MKVLSSGKRQRQAAVEKKRLFAIRKKWGGAQGIGAAPKGKKTKRWILIGVLAVVVILLILTLRSCGARRAAMESGYTYAQTERRDITDTLSGSGTLEPADSYTVTSLVSGDVLSAAFEEGDVVSKGDVLYEIDDADAATSIERAELSRSKSQRAYDGKLDSVADLTVRAPISGTITELSVRNGDTVGTQTAIASIANTSTMTLTEYYSDEYAGLIYAGMSATVSVPDQMLNLTGQVREVSSLKLVSDTGISCFAVTVQLTNPGALTEGLAATCWLSTADGDLYPSVTDDDGLDAVSSTKIYAKVSGTVSSVKVSNNVSVSAGQTILQLKSDTLDDEVLSAEESLRDAELSLQSQYDSLEDYTIKAPIDGTIVEKNYKQGETAEGGRTLCVIYDLSSLTLTLNVDELDIGEVSVGQKAVVTAEAAAGKSYEGVVTKLGINGTTTGGVTTYPVSIRIDKTEGLLPGMNVDVSIVVKESKNALAIPADAVEHNGRVLIKSADGATGAGAPQGYDYVQIETGAADDDYVEVLAGLKEGDTVAYIPETASGSDIFGQMGFGGGSGGPQGAGGNMP
jgi:HlyD family secretion protein